MAPQRGLGDDGAMFILYAVLAGLLLGVVTGGNAGRLGRLHFRWGLLIALGMVLQLSLFSSPLGAALGDLAPIAYVASNVMVLVAVGINLAIRGLAFVLLGGLSNVVAVVANGGYMPVSADALRAMSRLPQGGYSNSVLVEHVNLAPLTDIFAMPTFVPAANVFSVGDVLIGVGAAIAIVMAMHGRGPLDPEGPAPTATEPPAAEAGAPAH
jgi:hypothetical protein